jgi:hypothetical protein
MRQRVIPGGELDIPTPAEILKLIPPIQVEQESRIRSGMTMVLTAAGGGQEEIYKVPLGYEFELRRLQLDYGGQDTATNSTSLNAAGVAVQILRSGTLIEFANPAQAGGVGLIPGIQTWGSQQGPAIRNGEVLEVLALGLRANATLRVTFEGILTRPPAKGGPIGDNTAWS